MYQESNEKKKKLYFFFSQIFNAKRRLKFADILIRSIRTQEIPQRESSKVIRGWCSSSTRKRRKRIARRKIDGKSWLGDCIVLFLVRKQYLTIPFGDLNSYNGRQGEKEGGKSGQNVLLGSTNWPIRIDVIESRSVPSRIIFQSSLFQLSSMNFSP